MSKPNYEICRYVESIGNTAVFVTPNCPEGHSLHGYLVTTKSKCQKCKSCKRRVVTVNKEFDRKIREMIEGASKK